MRARPTLALAEVAADVGYTSAATVTFRRQVGVSPGARRQRSGDV